MAVDLSEESAIYFGLDCFDDEVRSRSRLSHPMMASSSPSSAAGSSSDARRSVDQTALQGIFEKVFKDLALDPQHYEVNDDRIPFVSDA